jgi:hypothetical protein
MARSRWLVFGVAVLVAACGGPPQGPPVAPPGNAGPALPPPGAGSPAQSGAAPALAALTPPAALPPVALPGGVLYACVNDANAEHPVTAIEFAPKVAALCGRHPEMQACQYERQACRRHGGRVLTADGREITQAIEAEYDRQVLRIRLQSN